MSDKVNIKTLNGHPLADEVARKAASENAERVEQLSEEIAELKNIENVPVEVTETRSGVLVTVTPTSGTTADVVSNITGQDATFVKANVIRLRHIKGKNLFDFVGFFGGAGSVIEKDGLTATLNHDGTATIKGTNTKGDYNNILEGTAWPGSNDEYVYVFPAGTYTLPSGLVVTCLQANKAWTSLGNLRNTFKADVPFFITKAYVTFEAGKTADVTMPLYMAEGSESLTENYAYNGQSYDAQFSAGIADGVFDWQTGQLKDAVGNLIEAVDGFDPFPVYDGENTFFTGLGKSTVEYKVEGARAGGTASEFTAEGKSVVGYSIAGHNLELAARMVAYQSGTGLPSPENVRPIAGFDVLTFTRTEDGAEIEVNLGETVYGGTVDLTTGVLTIDRGYLVVDGNSNVTRQAPNDGEDNICIAWNTGISTDYTKRLEDICDKLPHAVTVHVSNWEGANAQGTKYAECFSFGHNASTCMWLYIRLNKSRFAGSYEVADIKAWLAENPLTVTYALTEPRTVQLAPQTMAALTGINTLSTNATSMTVRGVDHPIGRTQTDQRYEPKKQIVGLPILELTGDNSEETKDNKVTLSYVWKNRQGTLTSKWQGSSSIAFGQEIGGKMNHTIVFDEAFEVVEGWGVQKKYVLKADVVDGGHFLNVIGAIIWGQMAATRTDDPDGLASMPNYGAIDGFPVIVELNGEFIGLYTWTIPKDAWMMGMGSGEQEAILCADKHVDATRFKAEAVCDGSDFKVEYVTNEDDAAWVKTSLNAMINACINSDGTDIDTNVAQRLNLASMIDDMIFVTMFDAHDNSDKNYTLSTKNGVRWFIGQYDMDAILGNWYDGSYYRPATDWLRNFYWWSGHNRAAYLIYTYKRAELKARYLELRAGVLSNDNLITTITNYVTQIPDNVYRADRERWPLLPNTSMSTVARAADWYCRRAAYIDKEVNGWT